MVGGRAIRQSEVRHQRAREARIALRIAVKPCVGAVTEQDFVRSCGGRGAYQGTNDSPRGESIFVTWSPKIYHEARMARLTE